MSVLVTGAAGFIGSHLCGHLEQRGARVIRVARPSVDRQAASLGDTFDLQLPSPELGSIMAQYRPSILVHCAGSSSVQRSVECPEADFIANVAVTSSVLESVRRHSPTTRFVFLSSAAVYGNVRRLPIVETSRVAPISPYGIHKACSELLCSYYNRVHNISTVCLRIFSAYGPGLKRQVLWDSCRAWRDSGEVVLSGSGQETRDFLHVKDVAEAISLTIERGGFRGDKLNVASGQSVTIRTLAGMLLARLGSGSLRFTGTMRKGDPQHWEANIGRVEKLGFRPSVELGEGLNEYVAWARHELE